MAIVLYEDGTEKLDTSKRINCKLYGVHCDCRRKCLAAFKKLVKLQKEDKKTYEEAYAIAYKNFSMPCDKYQD